MHRTGSEALQEQQEEQQEEQKLNIIFVTQLQKSDQSLQRLA